MVTEPLPSLEELKAWLEGVTPLQIELTASEALGLVVFLQMAAQDGDGPEYVTGVARAIAVAVGQRLAQACPAAADFIAAGWEPDGENCPKLEHWGIFLQESPLSDAFDSGLAPIQYSFTIASEAVGPHYLIDATRMDADQVEQLASVVAGLWQMTEESELQEIRERILGPGLPVKATHFTQVQSTPRNPD
jgi:hypothetical protein